MNESKTGFDSSQSTMKLSGIKQPKYGWKCNLTRNTYWMVEEGMEPNWFHRKMQEPCFGFKWERVK